MAPLDRTISLRAGQIRHLYSDNGTKFVGVNEELKSAIECWQDPSIKQYLNAKGITWHFNVPVNPHAGGLWERSVRSVKHHLHRVGGSRSFTYEELATLLARIEMCLNSRPLSAMSANPSHPAKFLEEMDGRVHHRAARPQQMANKEEKCPRWRSGIDRIASTPPTQWLLGRIVDVFSGSDDLVRSAEVRTQFKTFKRPIGQLVLLPTDSDVHESTEADQYNNFDH